MLEELFCAHRAELTAYCRGLCRSDAAAQDMVQEVFLRAWQNIGTLQDLVPSQRRAWLYRTARNLFVELGKMYGLPPATVRTRLAKARRYLSQLLMEE